MAFQIEPLSADSFRPLFSLSDAELAARNIDIHIADKKPAYPCRLGLRFADIGERLLLVNYEHLAEDTPYRASHAIYVCQDAESVRPDVDTVPESLRVPALSVRAFNAAHRIVDASIVSGKELGGEIERLFADPAIEYLHFHYATRGCYAARATRA
jgi:hypothetical protein